MERRGVRANSFADDNKICGNPNICSATLYILRSFGTFGTFDILQTSDTGMTDFYGFNMFFSFDGCHICIEGNLEAVLPQVFFQNRGSFWIEHL